jgi:hypothetical protein
MGYEAPGRLTDVVVEPLPNFSFRQASGREERFRVFERLLNEAFAREGQHERLARNPPCFELPSTGKPAGGENKADFHQEKKRIRRSA